MLEEIKTKVEPLEVKTPIELLLGIDDNGQTTAKKLYEFLELDVSHYSRWVKTNITDNPFVEEGVDFTSFATNGEWCESNSPRMAKLSEKPKVGRGNTQDFKLSANFAKKLCMQGKTERAEQAREYFVKVEEKLKEVAKHDTLKPSTQEKLLTITSRDFCKVLGKNLQSHGKIMDEIRSIITELEEMGVDRQSFFVDSTYEAGNHQSQSFPQFLCTEQGCEYYVNKLPPRERRQALAEVADRFERMRGALSGNPVRRPVKEPGPGQEIIRLYGNREGGALSMDGAIYLLSGNDFDLVKEMLPRLQKNGVNTISGVALTFLEMSDSCRKLEIIDEYAQESINKIGILENMPKGAKLGMNGNLSLEQVVNLSEAQAKARYNIGRANLIDAAGHIGATVRIGRKRLYNREKMDEYFFQQAE